LEEDSREAEWNRESQWVLALAAGGARGEFEAEGSKIMAVVGVHGSYMNVQVDTM